MEFLILIGIIWVICSILTYGLSLGFIYKEFKFLPRSNEVYLLLFIASFGPIGLILVLINCKFGKHGFKWWIK